ncbi:PAS domain S-box protein [Salinimonas sp. HHU 13199]|uniref:histidine kinase n=1 Tax=Salinimonas profundi TaxID=2729140 RepID=A0ABR8LD76_9ALTE|nr:MHYT domain-containing protein [Salinimonas profundi]MBD3584260.1 PAS domain S-box protein [Salinimonas profundi]
MLQWLTSQFLIPADSAVIQGSYDTGLVTLSLAIAVFASFMAFSVAGQVSETIKLSQKQALLGVGSMALGAGIWGMHFVGMLAFNLNTAVNYDWSLTGLSFIPGWVAAWIALHILCQAHLRRSHIVMGGVLVGAGIGSMHYAGMAAMQMGPMLRYDPFMFGLSILVAVVLAMLALWIRYGLNRIKGLRGTGRRVNAIASLVMGLAICGMHYTGMAAARFVRPESMMASEQSSEITMLLAALVSIIVIVIITLVLGVTLLIKYRNTSTRALESEKTLRAIMDTAVDGVMTIGGDGVILEANPAIGKILGFTPAELKNTSVYQVIPPARRHEYMQLFSDQPQKSRIWSKVIGGNRDVTALHKSGQEVPVRVGVGHTRINQKHYFIAFISDISERIKMESALRESEAKFRSFFTNVPGVAFRCLNEPAWPMVFITDAVEGITGYPASAFTHPNPSVSFVDICHPDDLPIISDSVKSQDAFSIEYRIIHKDGSIRWMREQGMMVCNEKGNTSWLDGFIFDITERRQMEEELVIAKDVAEQAAATRAAFMANMSHEIRTPMNAIIGFSDLLLDESLNDTQHKHCATINRSARSLLHLLNDILNSAKLEKGKLELEFRDFVLTDEVDTVVSTFWLEAQRKSLLLNVNLDKNLADAYNGVPERIRQVLNNLIGNAVKFTEKGSISLTITAQGNAVKFVVSDTGIGMTQEQLARVFDAFSQADASMSRRFGGTGLGTTISKQLVELMGGSISAISEIGKGSEFSFELPLTPVKRPVLQQPLHTISLSPRRVLVVDDISQNSDLITLLLQRDHHQVEVAQNGLEALEKMAASPFDVVLMDLQMPVMDGLTAARKRREFEANTGAPHVPIIALTASVLVQDKQDARSAGMEGFANKPVDYDQLYTEMARVLGELDDTHQRHVRHSTKNRQIINWKKGEALWAEKSRHIAEVRRFADKLTTDLDTLAFHVRQEAPEQAASLAHTLKGVAGNLALEKLHGMFAGVEQDACDEGRVTEIRQQVKAILALPEFAEQTEHTDESSPLGRQQLLTLLQALRASICEHQLDDNNIDKIRSINAGRYHEQLERIINLIDDFEFDQATVMADKLISSLEVVQEVENASNSA